MTDHAALKALILGLVREYHALAHAPLPFVPGTSRVPYAGRVFGPEELEALVDAALDFWLTLGPWGHKFERGLQARFPGSRDAVMVSSGSTANLAAIMALVAEGRLRAGDEVVTPVVTFPTTLAPLLQHGLRPVFVDAEVGTYNVDPRLLERALGPRTRAMVLPHTLGIPFDLDVVTSLCQQHDLVLVEDGCDAFGSRWRGRPVGTFGALSTLSFYPAHHLTTGEGGAVIVNETGLVKAVRSVRDWGRDCWCEAGKSNTCGRRFTQQHGDLPAGYDHKYVYARIGSNLKPTDLQAAIGVAQLARLDDFIDRRRANFARLYAALVGYQDRLVLPRAIPGSEPAWFGFPLTVLPPIDKSNLVAHLEAAGIETRPIFAGNILRHPAYRGIEYRQASVLAESDRIMRDSFFVGVYPGLGARQMDYVAGTIVEGIRR